MINLCREDDFPELTVRLEKNDPTLTEISISIGLPLPKMTKLEKSLKRNTSLRRLTIASTRIGKKSAGMLADIIRGSIYIQNLHIQKSHICSHGMLLIADAIKKNIGLKTIHLSNSENKDIYMGVGEALVSNPVLKNTLETIVLETCDIGFNELCQFIRISTALRVLKLLRHGLQSTQLTELVNSINDNPTLETLDLGYTILGDECAKILFNALKTNNSIKILNMNNTGITHSCGVIIGEVLKENTILQVLSLSDNHLGNDGITYISIGLSKNSSLHTLNLKNNGITSAGSLIFSGYMVKNKTLQEINLDRNHIDSLGLSYICQYINTNTLQKLSLDHNDGIDVNGILPVITALKSNRGLLELKINCNQKQRLVRDMDTITLISSKLIEMLEYNTTIQEITLMYTVYLSENNMNSSYSFCLAHNNEIIMLLLKRNKVIKHIAIMRIHRFWRDVCYNPTYSHARERLCRGLETPPESKKRKREDELA